MTSREHMRLGGGGNTAWNEKLCERSPGEGKPWWSEIKTRREFCIPDINNKLPSELGPSLHLQKDGGEEELVCG